MNRERLDQILAEKEANPEVYKRDGYLYLDEALPLLEDMLALKAVKPKENKEEKKVEKDFTGIAGKQRPEVETAPPKKVDSKFFNKVEDHKKKK